MTAMLQDRNSRYWKEFFENYHWTNVHLIIAVNKDVPHQEDSGQDPEAEPSNPLLVQIQDWMQGQVQRKEETLAPHQVGYLISWLVLCL